MPIKRHNLFVIRIYQTYYIQRIMNKTILTIALAVLALAGASAQTSAQTGTRAIAQAPANVQAVDLGLPSGTRWASCNVGATTPEDYGNYYAWGETAPKEEYSWENYKYCNGDLHKLTKYCTDASYGNNGFTDNKMVLEPEDDAATVNWGRAWRMPTAAEVDELCSNCTCKWATQNGVGGFLMTSKTNGNSIFLPAAGNCYDTNVNDGFCSYWSSSLGDGDENTMTIDGYVLAAWKKEAAMRLYGATIRPVQVAGPANVQATQGDTTGVTVTWDAVPDAVSYEITAESWDVAINRTVRTKTATETHIKDTIPVRPGLGRYTVKAVFADGTKSEASEPAIGYAVLETMRLRGISTRWPWNGKVDIDIEYKTVRPRFQELFGQPDLPYPAVTLTARTADGKLLPMRTLDKEPAVDHNYTVNRKVVQNGTAIFSGSGWLRIVWDADTDTLGIHAPGTTITLTASDDYARTTDSATVDVNTTKPEVIMIGKNDTIIPLRWAARWADEASRSLNMQDGSDFELITYTRYATVIDTIYRETQVPDEERVIMWRPDYGITYLKGLLHNRAISMKGPLDSCEVMFMRSPEIPVTVEPMPGECAIDIRWKGAGYCEIYQIVRRTVNRDGTRNQWRNMAPVSLYGEGHPEAGTGRYIDIGVSPGITYEYAACPMYNDPRRYVDPVKYPNPYEYITADPVLWSAGRVPMDITLDVQSVGQNSIGLSWTDVPDAYTYDVYRNSGDGQYQKIGNIPYTTGTTFTDTRAEPGVRYTYKVTAFNYKGDTLDTSAPVAAYSQLDVLSLKRLEPRFPWNGLVDVFVSYRSAREAQEDGTPHFQLVATSGNDTLDMKTLTLASAQTLDQHDITLPDDGTVQHLVWDARTDLGANNYPQGLILTVSCTRVEPYQGKDTTTAFDWEPVTGGFVPLDLRRTPEVQLGSPTTVFADLGWFEGATRLEVFVNGTSVFNTTDGNNYSFPLGKEQLNIWGTNTLKLKSDNGIEQTAQIKSPDFVFTATQGNRDSIIVEWNRLQDIHAYSIRRRAANTADAFVEVALVQDTTRWADTSEETIVGEFEYTIMPLLASNEDAGPQPAAVIGYRAQDIARSITISRISGSGSVRADKPMAHYGETIMLTVAPAEGWELEQLHVVSDETEVSVSHVEGENYTFAMPAGDVVISAVFKVKTGVEDIPVTDITPRKVFRHGQVLILRAGKTYTLTGDEVQTAH